MARSLKQMIDALPPARQARINKRAAALVAEERTLQDLRRAMKQTQAAVARRLKIKQENVSRIESRTDLLLSTLELYVAALGGKLRFVAEFPDRPLVVIDGLGSIADDHASSRKAAAGKTPTRRRAV